MVLELQAEELRDASQQLIMSVTSPDGPHFFSFSYFIHQFYQLVKSSLP